MRTSVLVAAMLAATASPALADVRSGVEMWERGDFSGAVREWRPLAVAGDPDAQYNLAQGYKLGRGLPVDLKLAESWYARAAKQGHRQARDNYGLILFQNGNRQAALPYIEESAGQGEPRAQYVLGTALFNGDLVKKDWVRAYALMTRASASGIAAASTSLAQMDKFVPLDQRQRGLTLARTLEQSASRPQLASLDTPSAPARTARPAANPVRTETLPPSRPATGAPPAPEVKATPALPASKPITSPDVPSRAQASTSPAANPSPGGRWRVQFGAFADAGNATALWPVLKRRVAALAPYQSYTPRAGNVTRLQAGPLATRTAADRLCASVRAAGQACVSVAPSR